MKKVLAFCLALLLVLSMAACNNNVPTEDKSTTAAPTQAPTQKPDDKTTDAPQPSSEEPTAPSVEEPRLPLVKDGEHVTLTIGIPLNAFVEDYDTNYLTRYLEEKTGVDLEFVFYDTDYEQANQQFSLDVSSGNKLPDILFNFNKLTGDSDAAMEYGRTGVFVDVSGYLNEKVTFTVEAEGDGLTYMWQSNLSGEWKNTSFATSKTDILEQQLELSHTVFAFLL